MSNTIAVSNVVQAAASRCPSSSQDHGWRLLGAASAHEGGKSSPTTTEQGEGQRSSPGDILELVLDGDDLQEHRMIAAIAA